jgi:hypothetical protein
MEKGILKVGDRVNWLYEPRGGHGYVMSVAAVVTKIAPKKVQIRVAKRVDDKWVGVTRWVEPQRSTRRVGSAGEAEQALAVEFDRELSSSERASQLDSAVSQAEQLRDQQVQQQGQAPCRPNLATV